MNNHMCEGVEEDTLEIIKLAKWYMNIELISTSTRDDLGVEIESDHSIYVCIKYCPFCGEKL